MIDHCCICGKLIEDEARQGTGFCSAECKKKKEDARALLQHEADMLAVRQPDLYRDTWQEEDGW